MTQEELAGKAGVGIRTVRDIEAGRVRPQPKTLRLLVAALGLDEAERARLAAAVDRPPVVPRELPRDPSVFAGRERPLQELLDAADAGAAVIAVHGMAGVGKTTLALRLAHTLAPDYPDGQLFVDLHGYSRSPGPPPSLESTLARVLRRLGVGDQRLSDDLDELTAQYRSAMAGRRVLVLLDDAPDAEYVEAFLPGTAGSLVLATSRRDLSALAGAHSLPLEPPAMPDAVAMVSAAVSDRITEAEAESIAERCGRLPLALSLAAARLRSRPLWGAEDLLERLADEDRLLDELDTGHRGVAAALLTSYCELDSEHRRLLRRLGLCPGDDFDPDAAAALCEVSGERAAAMLESLVDVHLLETRSPGRYRAHDLVRLFAARLAAREESEADRAASLARLLRLYLRFAYQAAARVHPNKRRFTEAAAEYGGGRPGFADQASSLEWFQIERRNLEAAVVAAEQAGLIEQAWHLATAFNAFFVHDPDIGPHAVVNRIALQIADRTGDSRKGAYTLGDTGRQLLAAGRHREAIAFLERSVALKRDLGEFGDAALTLANIGVLKRRSGLFAESVEVHRAALAQAELAADADAAALIRTNMVVPLLRLGRFDEAERLLEAAEERLDDADEHNRIRIAVFRGVLDRERGDPAAALAGHTACLNAYHGEGVTADVAATLIELGEDLLRLDRGAEAAGHFARAVEYAVRLADPSLERSGRNGLGRALAASGRTGPALDQFEKAAGLAERHEDAYELARAHHGLAEAHRARGDAAAERRHLRLAAEGYTACGVPEADAIAGLPPSA